MNKFNLIKQWIVNNYPQLGWLIRYKQEIDEDNEKDFIFGADNGINRITRKEDGDWNLDELLAGRSFFEIQKGRFFDSIGCTAYGTLNGMELLAYVIWKAYWNKSDRYTNKVSGNTRSGNLVPRVLESIRKNHGVVNEKDWGWDRETFNWNKYYATIPQSVKDMGKNWIKAYDFNYERCGADHNSIKAGLKFSPVGVGVYAWYKKGDKYYSVANPNHWIVIIKQVWGQYYLILDSYEPFIKKLDWNYKFHFPRIFYINKKELKYNQAEINKLMAKGFKYIQRPLANGEIYELSDKGLKHLTAEEARDFGIKTLEKAKQLIGIHEGLYNRLLK